MDYCHLELLCKLIAALRSLAKVLGPWPTVVVTALVLGFAGYCALHAFGIIDHAFSIIELIVKAAFAVFLLSAVILIELLASRVERVRITGYVFPFLSVVA